jgi:hypothetical protein
MSSNFDQSGDQAKLAKVREAWRRLEAQGNPLQLGNGEKRGASQSLADPTPERRAKAVDVGHRMVGRREIRKIKTTADLLQDRGHLPRHLRQALDELCVAVVEAMNVAVDDRDSGSARLVSSYDGAPVTAHGPREISDRVLDARTKWKLIERQVPQDLFDVLSQLVAEETGHLEERPKSLQRYGRAFGWEVSAP